MTTSGASNPGSQASEHSAGIRSGTRFVTRAQVFDRAARQASGFERLGVGPGDTVAILARNDVAFIEATIAASMLGAYAVPINWHFKAREARYILEDSRAKVLVAHADLFARVLASDPGNAVAVLVETPPEVAAAYDVAPADRAVPPGVLRLEDLVASNEPRPRDPTRRPVSMIYTSGTTGRPKGVRRRPFDERQASLAARVSQQVLGMRPGMRTVIPAPLYHTAPNTYAIAALLVGAYVVLMARFDPEELLATIERERITHVQLVPTMFHRLLRLPEEVRKRYDHSSLEHVVHAAAPCPPEVKRRMIDWWGPIIHEYYGATETGAITACDSFEWLAHPGTVGRPVEGAAVRILRADGSPAPSGEPGEVWVRHDAFIDFTYQNDDEARRAIERDGFVHCGDLGYLDDEGYLYLVGRSKELVISGGVNLYPAEIEAVILELDGVRDCAVFGIPDEEYGEALAAAVELEPGARLDADAVRSHVARHLASMKVPKVVTFHDALPREDSGKIFKARLAAPWWEQERGSDPAARGAAR